MQTGVLEEKKSWADAQRGKPLKPIAPHVEAILAVVPEGDRARVRAEIGAICGLMYRRGWYAV
jgi:hypothetical protein